MTFFGLFKTQAERDRENQIRFRQGKSRIQRFIQQARESSEQYWKMANQAYKLGDKAQLRQLAAGYFRARENINRWERFLLKMDALEMRRNEVEATSDFVRSINALTSTILRGTSPAEIAKMQLELEQAIARSDQDAEMMTEAMNTTGSRILSADDLTEGALEGFLSGIDPTFSITDKDKEVGAIKPELLTQWLGEKG